MVGAVFEGGDGVEDDFGLAEGFEDLFVDVFDVGDELVDVKGEEDERDEDDGGEADCRGWLVGWCLGGR